MKKITCFIVGIILSLSLISSVYADSQDLSKSITWEYTIYSDDTMQNVVDKGEIPSSDTRYTWPGTTLKNGEVAVFTPSDNYKGLYCNSGHMMTISYGLNRSAYHRVRVCGFLSGTASQYVRELTSGGLAANFVPTVSDHYYGTITNLSSDSITITSFKITF